jgi:hypothetical protein
VKIAFPTDEHFPFQDDKARSIALKIVSDFNPDLLITGSDGIDFYAISSFDKNPERAKVNLQDEIDGWRKGQLEWRDAAPNAKRTFIPGNHEDRLRRYLWRHPEIASLKVMSLPKVLGLEDLGIEYSAVDYSSHEIAASDQLIIKHGQYVRRGSGQSARAELEHEHFSISILTGHTHRGGSFFATTRSGVVQAHECFCLCRLDPDYIARPDWQQGIVLAEVGKTFLSVEPVPFHGSPFGGTRGFRCQKKAIWRGKEYRS